MAATTLYPAQKSPVAYPQHILIATDLTELDSLLTHAIAQARAVNATITLVHAVSPLYAASMGGAEIPVTTPAQLIDDVRLALADYVIRVQAAGVGCEVDVRIGAPADVIGAVTRRYRGNARIIMGTHGRGKLRQLALGSVAHDLIADGDTPIFIVGPHARDGERNALPHHLLHAVSFTGNYESAARQVFALAKAHGAHVTLLHVLDSGSHADVNPARMLQWAHTALGQLAEISGLSPEYVHLQVVSGNVPEQVVRIARQAGVNWIAFATSEDTSASVLNESRAFRVMAEAECPVLLFRS